MQGNAKLTRAILDADEDKHELKPEVLEIAMVAAARFNTADCMAEVLAAREAYHVSLNSQLCNGLTPLMVAAAFGSVQVGQR